MDIVRVLSSEYKKNNGKKSYVHVIEGSQAFKTGEIYFIGKSDYTTEKMREILLDVQKLSYTKTRNEFDLLFRKIMNLLDLYKD